MQIISYLNWFNKETEYLWFLVFCNNWFFPFFLSLNFERETITAPPLFSAPGLNDRLLYMKTGPNNDLTSHFIIQHVFIKKPLPNSPNVLLSYCFGHISSWLTAWPFFSPLLLLFSERRKEQNSSLSRSAGKQHSLEVSYRKLFFCSAPLFVSRFSL